MAKESYYPPVGNWDGHTYVMQAHICQCATSMKNHWSGDIYEKSLEHLVCYLLVAWLAPEWDTANKEHACKYTEKKIVRDTAKNETTDQLSCSHLHHAMH